MNTEKAWMAGSIGALVFLALTVALLHQIVDPDIWYHLSIGREIVKLGALPTQEFLVYPNANLPGAFHEWGFGLLNYFVYQSWGFTGMSILNALVCALMFWFLFRAANDDRPLTWFVATLLLIPVYFWMEVRLTYRVEIYLYLAMACELWLLEHFLRQRDWRWLAPIPLVGLLLSQMHPSVIILLVVLGTYALQVLWDSRSSRSDLSRYAAWFALCGVATLLLAMINPYGWEQVLLPLTFAGERRITNIISEFLPALLSPFKWEYIIMLAISAIVIVANRRRRLVDMILLLGFGFLAYRYVRNVGMFALVMYLPMARGLTDVLENIGQRLSLNQQVAGTGRAQWGLWVLAVAVMAGFTAERVTRPDWGWGIQQGRFPLTAARLIRDIKPPGRIFNQYEFGGYLGWVLGGKYQVSIDGRHYAANRAFAFYNGVTYARHGWQTALDRYGVNTLILKATRSYEAQLIPLVRILANDPNWLLAGRWDNTLLFFRKGAVANLKQGFYRDKSEIWQQVREDAEAFIDFRPDRIPAYYSLAEALWGLGDLNAAVDAFQHYLKLKPDDRKAVKRFEQLEAELAQGHNGSKTVE